MVNQERAGLTLQMLSLKSHSRVQGRSIFGTFFLLFGDEKTDVYWSHDLSQVTKLKRVKQQ
jgi:hypothetical protein